MLVENNVTKIPTERKTISWKSLAVASIVLLVALAVGQIVISNSKSTVTPTDVATPSASVMQSARPSVTPTASPSVSKSSSVASPAASGEVALSISAARGNAKIDVVVDGTHVYKGPIFQGDVKSFTGVTAISIYLSNAGDLDLTLNGQTLAPLGARNEEIRKTFRSK